MQPSKRRNEQYERLEARVAPKQKALFQHAADLLGRSLTDFTVSTLQEAANRVIQAHEIIQLSLRDQHAFAKALFHPPKPSKPLLNAAKRLQKIVKRVDRD